MISIHCPEFTGCAKVNGHTVYFPDDSAPSITLLHLNKKSPKWYRTQVIRQHIPLEARRMYNEKRAEWIEGTQERQEQAIVEYREDRKVAVTSMRRSLGTWQDPKDHARRNRK